MSLLFSLPHEWSQSSQFTDHFLPFPLILPLGGRGGFDRGGRGGFDRGAPRGAPFGVGRGSPRGAPRGAPAAAAGFNGVQYGQPQQLVPQMTQAPVVSAAAAAAAPPAAPAANPYAAYQDPNAYAAAAYGQTYDYR